MVPLAIGSQTNGSMIRPAAFCGVFGVKPSHGLISRAGALTLSRTLDHVGAFARSLEDLALILDVLAGHDPADPDTRPYAAPNFRAGAVEPPPLPPSFALRAHADVGQGRRRRRASALEDLAKELGAREVDLPDDYRAAWDAQRAIMAADMAHQSWRLRRQGRRESASGSAISSPKAARSRRSQYLAAVRDARRYAEGMMGIFEQLSDAIITLSARGVAPQGHRRDRRPGVLHVVDADRAARRSTCRCWRTTTGCRSASSWSVRRAATSGCCAPRAPCSAALADTE